MISMFWQWIESRRRSSYKVALLLFGLGLCQPQNARAQWTVPDSNQNIHNTNTGNVGINTTNPQRRLHIVGADGVVPTFPVNALGPRDQMLIENNSNCNLSLISAPSALSAVRFVQSGTSSGNSGLVLYDHSADALAFWTNSSEKMRIDSSGNMGIGTTAPAALLDVNGGFFHTTFNSGAAGVLPTLNNQGGLTVGWNRSNSAAEVNFYNVFTGGTVVTAFQFSKMVNATTPQDLMTIQGNGNVGIGTTNPTSLLHVAGTLTANSTISGSTLTATATSGTAISAQALITSSATGNAITAPNGTILAANIVANYQDVAEWVPASMKIPAGTVVVIDAGVTNHVSPSSTPYDTRVAGVISANPGVILGQRGEGKVMVATTGRVRVRVDATRAPICVGDLLVTSDREGVAMRSMPVDLGGTPIHRPGTLIGKALEPLASGTGEILVLLSLQ